ncbi:MAG: hypothetical protein E6767_16250 [Dysgonomonas sp.]|nr:hypothetical protein [Dysgonomonas sp.]
MRTLSIILLTLFLTSFSSDYNNNETKSNDETTVIICTGKFSKCYHNSMCRGMKACKGESKKVYLSEAKKMGLRECKFCYK